MIEIISIVGIMIGIPALYLAYISYRNQSLDSKRFDDKFNSLETNFESLDDKFEGKFKSLEDKFREKEQIKLLIMKLNDINETVCREYLTNIRDPLSNEDTRFQLNSMGQNILSQAFDDKKDVVNVRISVDMYGDFKDIKGIEKDSDTIKKSEIVYINSVDEFDTYFEEDDAMLTVYAFTDFNLHHDLFRTWILFQKINTISKEHGDLINQFSPNLLYNLNDLLKDILVSVVESAIDHNMMEVEPKKFDNTLDIALYIHNTIVASEKVKHDTAELEILLDKIDEIKSALLTTAYA